MAFTANSTPVPVAQAIPQSPLPARACQAWHDLWASVCLIHPDAPRAFSAAYSAGVDPSSLCLVQLVAPKDRVQAMPRLWFGEGLKSPCRIFSPVGEVQQ